MITYQNHIIRKQHVLSSIEALGIQHGKYWDVCCNHVERVKSYAPKVYHLVADIHCTPKVTLNME